MSKLIGVLTSGGDTPGLNAAIRGLGKSLISQYGYEVIGFRDGFRGIVHNRFVRLGRDTLSDILTVGGTILGTSRDKPHKMLIGGVEQDLRNAIIENYERHHLDALVCLGGGGTQKNALKLKEKGLNILTLPKTIDNDVAFTDVTFGFDTALSIATEAIDRLHSTAYSHHRIILVETMGHRVGWLALGAGLAGGADVILVPEIPYDIDSVSNAIQKRIRLGKRFSIVAVAEGCISKKEFASMQKLEKQKNEKMDKKEMKAIDTQIKDIVKTKDTTLDIAKELEQKTGLESRVTILGHLQRGGTPSAADRLLATRLGTACAEAISENQFGYMIASKNNMSKLIPLEQVAGNKKYISQDHPWIKSARMLGICLGD